MRVVAFRRAKDRNRSFQTASKRHPDYPTPHEPTLYSPTKPPSLPPSFVLRPWLSQERLVPDWRGGRPRQCSPLLSFHLAHGSLLQQGESHLGNLETHTPYVPFRAFLAPVPVALAPVSFVLRPWLSQERLVPDWRGGRPRQCSPLLSFHLAHGSLLQQGESHLGNLETHTPTCPFEPFSHRFQSYFIRHHRLR